MSATPMSPPLPHTGEAPYGSCLLQATANALALRGIDDAPALLGVTFGATWVPGAVRLGGARRWDCAATELCGLAIERLRFDTWADADDAELRALAAGHALVVAVDSFDIPSPYEGTSHLMHALLIEARADQTVVVRDAMNRPDPSAMTLAAYRASRRSAVVDRHELVTVRGSFGGAPAAPAALLEALCDDAARHADDDDAVLDAYVSAVAGGAEGVDVADVAAERLYTHRMLASIADEIPAAAALATSFASLSRRWYLAHTLALESQAGRPLKPGRLASVLTDLHTRERGVREQLRALRAPTAGPTNERHAL